MVRNIAVINNTDTNILTGRWQLHRTKAWATETLQSYGIMHIAYGLLVSGGPDTFENMDTAWRMEIV
jgi:hypothetical protein